MKSQFQWLSIEFKCYLRNFPAMFFSLVFPPLRLIIFGESYGSKPMYNGLNVIDISVPAYICMIICITGIMSLPVTLATYRERKILKRFKATPTTPTHIIGGQLFVNLVVAILGAFLLILTAKVRYGFKFSGNILLVCLAFLLNALCCFAIGFAIASFANDSKSSYAISNVVYFPMIFISGATIPLEIMSDSIRTIAKFLPATYGVEIMKAAWNDGSLSGHGKAIAILAVVTVVFSALSAAFFKWDSDNV